MAAESQAAVFGLKGRAMIAQGVALGKKSAENEALKGRAWDWQ
jgi:hypothetical protein